MKEEQREKLRDRVAAVVSQVVLQTTGKSVAPRADQPLFPELLDPLELPQLVLVLQNEFDVTLKPYEANERVLCTVDEITAVLARRL